MPYQQAPDPPVDAALRAACADALHVLTQDGDVIVGAEAVRFVYEALGYRSARLLGLPGVRDVARVGYRWVANHRIAASKLFFRTPEDQSDDDGISDR